MTFFGSRTYPAEVVRTSSAGRNALRSPETRTWTTFRARSGWLVDPQCFEQGVEPNDLSDVMGEHHEHGLRLRASDIDCGLVALHPERPEQLDPHSFLMDASHTPVSHTMTAVRSGSTPLAFSPVRHA